MPAQGPDQVYAALACLLKTARLENPKITGQVIAVEQDVKRQLSAVLKVPAHRIDAQTPLEAYGIDSVMAMQLTNALEKGFGALSKTLFFEYQTIEQLSLYFMVAYRSELLTLFNKTNPPRKAPADVPRPDRQSVALATQGYRRWFRVLSAQRAPVGPSGPLDIAIIGLE